MEVLLEPDETQTLLDVLRSYSSDLRMEIVDTDNPAYKRPLKHQREVIDSIVTKLGAATSAAAAKAENPGEAGEVAAEDQDAVVGRVALRIIAVW